MNYDGQQYTFSHGLATAPQLHLQQQIQQHQLQQQQQFQQQQQIFQQRYSHPVPTSNIYQFQFAGSSGPLNHIFQEKDAQQMGVMGGIQTRFTQHNLVPQPLVKQGVQVGIDVVNGLDAMIYQQKNNLKIIANSDGRLMQQADDTSRIQQNLLGVDMMRSSNFIDQSMNAQQNQHQGIRVAGHNMFTYGKQNFSSWIQPQQINISAAQSATGCQSSLPSFNNVWSPFQSQKQVDALNQQQINQYQQSQQFHNQLHTQQQQQQQNQMQAQIQFNAPAFQTTSIQRIKPQQQKPSQISVPVSLQTLSHTPQSINCFSPQLHHISPRCVDKEIPNLNRDGFFVEAVNPNFLQQPITSTSCVQPLSSCIEHHPTTAVTYTISGPPKVTVTLDSLTHSESFPPNKFSDKQDVSFNSHIPSAHFLQEKTAKAPSNLPASLLAETFHSQAQRDWQTSQNQRNSCLSKPLLHSSSTGSSLERSSSESSNFSSPPYIFTPPGSSDSVFSLVLTHFPKSTSDNSSSGRTSALSSSSSSMSLSSSPPITLSLSSQPGNQYATPVTATSSIASSTCTVSTAAVVSSCSSVAITTTSVISTTTTPKESTSIVSDPTCISAKKTGCCISENFCRSCSPPHRPSSTLPDAGMDKIVRVPYSWQRKFENGVIVYLSPSGVVLQSLDQICHYLLSDSTCKCGLECPIQLEKFFSFDPEVESQAWNVCSAGEKLGNLCNHRREILALAAFHSSQSEAAVRPAGHGMWLGRKRERRKAVSAGEDLIVTPFKKLKTRITNAVNKHAMSIGNSVANTPPAGDSFIENKPGDLDTDSLFQSPRHRASSSPVRYHEAPESCSNHSDVSSQADSLSPGISDFQISQSGEDEKLCLGSVAMQNIGDQDRCKQDLYNTQKHQAMLEGNSGQHSNISAGDSHAFCQGNHQDLMMNMQNQYPMTGGSHSNQQIMQYPQGERTHQHQQQPMNPGLCFPQNHLYPNIQQQQPQGFHAPIWQGSYQDNPASIPHHHHHPSRSYPSVINFQHSNFSQSQPNAPVQQPLDNKVQVDCIATKSKRPKNKKAKQKQTSNIVEYSFPCSKVSPRSAKTTVIPSKTASFFGNPIVFVEQQTAIIKNSISSCQVPFSSPSPTHCDSTKRAVAYPPLNVNTSESVTKNYHKTQEHIKSESVEVQDKTESVHKEDDDDHKTGTDLESNKSFSDTMENNDSAYLSQTGSDQERSDMLDGLDSCLETKPKLLDVYSFNSAESADRKQNVAVGLRDTKFNKCSISPASSKNGPKGAVKKQQQEYTLVVNKISNIVAGNKKVTKSKPRQKAATRNQDGDMLATAVAGNLNGDLSQLLASNNWNILALQQVLANYSGDPGQLNAVVQQVQSLTNAGLDFPASNLLSAAARAQLNFKQKEPITVSAQCGKNPTFQNLKIEVLPAQVVSSSPLSDLKTGIVSTTICGTTVSPVVTQHQLQPSFQPVTGTANLLGNMMHFQQFPSGSFAMNMLIASNGQGHMYATDALNSGTFTADSDMKTGQGAMNPLMAQGILTTVSQTGDISSQIKLPMGSVIPSSLGSNATLSSSLGPNGSTDSNTVLLNSFGPGVIMNAPMPPVSVSVVTNVTKSLAQVVPAIGINQTIFGAQHVAQHLMNSHQNSPQLINTVPATAGTHMISTSPQAAQLITTAPQGAQFVNHTAQRPQLINSAPHSTQIMNALSVGGFNNQLLITNPVQQISPSSSLSQLSPAMATQLLAQGHHLPQISPSYLQNQILKQSQNSVISNQNIYANVSLPTLTVTSDSTEDITGPIGQAGIINNNIQKSHRICDGLDKVGLANTLSQISDANSSLGNSSMYATTSQPLFVIPQQNPNPMMQMLGSAQTLNTTSGMQTDLNMSQGNISQLFGQSVDQAGIQSLLAAGCSPLAIQQMMNSISLNGVQQQQQQLQLLQLHQLMQQLQNQGQNIQGISLPLSHTSNPGQATAIGGPTIVSTLMPQAGLQLNSLMDINTLHPCLSPVAQGYQNQLSPATAPLQHISSALAVQQVTHVNSCGAVSVDQSGGMQNLMQIPAKHLQAGHTLQQQQMPANQFPCGSYENVLRLHGCNVNRSLI